MSDALHFLTLAAAARLIAARELSPVEYTQALIARIDALDDQVNAFITRTDALALEQARTAEKDIMQGRPRGPLHGIPFGLKDIYDTAGIRTTGHSRLGLHNIPAANAAAAQRLLDAGGVLLGKLATHEYASGGPSLDLPWPPARNPWDTARFTGGSSSGSGAAVAAGFMPLALGTDTGGSIRIPAALCGLVGLKPTYGLVSRRGVIPNSFTFDHCGPLTWTVEDCALVLQCIAGHDPQDPASAQVDVPHYATALTGDIRALRIGVVRHFWEDEGTTAPEMADAMERALEVFADLGAILGTARLRSRQAYNDVKMVIAKTELIAIHERALRERLADFGDDFVGRNLPAFLFTAGDYIRAQRERRRMLAELAPLYDRFDILLTASATPAARLDELIGSGFADKWEKPNIYTPFSVSAGPALVVCNGFTRTGLPLAMQLAGRPFDEPTVLNAGHAYERATDWRSVRPQLTSGARQPPLSEPAVAAAAGVYAIDSATRSLVDSAIARAGLTLSATHRALLYRVAPSVLAAVDRIPHDHPHALEPANTFTFGLAPR